MFAKQIWKFRWVSLLLLLSTVSWVVLVPWYGKCCCCCAPNANVIEFESKLVSNTCGIMQRMFTILYYIASSLSYFFLRARQRRCWKKGKKNTTWNFFPFLFILSSRWRTHETHSSSWYTWQSWVHICSRRRTRMFHSFAEIPPYSNCNVIKLYPFWVSLPGNKIRNFSFSYFVSFSSPKIDILNSLNSEFSYIFDNVEFFQWNSSGSRHECGMSTIGTRLLQANAMPSVRLTSNLHSGKEKKITKLVSPAGSILIDAHHRPSSWKDIDDI